MFIQATNNITDAKPSQVVLNFGSKFPSLLLDVETRMILGRRGITTDEFVVDLSVFNAYELGVSRKHALLYVENGQIYVEDLGSDEGTFLNDNLLTPFKAYPVPNSAILKLGRLAIKVWRDFKIPAMPQ